VITARPTYVSSFQRLDIDKGKGTEIETRCDARTPQKESPEEWGCHHRRAKK